MLERRVYPAKYQRKVDCTLKCTTSSRGRCCAATIFFSAFSVAKKRRNTEVTEPLRVLGAEGLEAQRTRRSLFWLRPPTRVVRLPLRQLSVGVAARSDKIKLFLIGISGSKIIVRKLVTTCGWESWKLPEANVAVSRHHSASLRSYRGDPCGRPGGASCCAGHREH